MTVLEQRRWLELRAIGRNSGFSPEEKAEMEDLDRLFDEHDAAWVRRQDLIRKEEKKNRGS